MLIIRLHNDGTGSDESANYNAEVRVNLDTIWLGRVEGHNRADGWPTLLRLLADATEEGK